nr:hypothetical protein [uncultured Lachnoclostridium sp.]
MAQYTENYNLELQQGEDFIDVNGLSRNFNAIDGELKNLEDDKAHKDHKHKTSDITDFPTALPADGGNAGTVGGKSEAQLIKYSDIYDYTEGRIISDVLSIDPNNFSDSMRVAYGVVPGTVNSPPGVGYGVRLPCIAYDRNGVLVTVVQLDPVENQGKVWTNLYRKHLNQWTGWRAGNDSGNASTLGGLDNNKFVQWKGTVSTAVLNDSAYPLNYEGDVNEETAVSIGLPHAWWHIEYKRHTNTAGGFGVQVFHPLNNSSLSPLYRTSMGKTYDPFKKYCDGGNANTVNGIHLVVLTQAAYDALGTKDANTIYFTT